MVKDKQKDSINGTRLGGWGQSVLGSGGEVKKSKHNCTRSV